MKDFIQKHWKTILIILLAMMWCTKCTQSCNRNAEIVQKTADVDSLTNIINEQAYKIHDYEKDMGWLEANKDDISKIASSNQADYINKISDLNEQVAALKDDNSKLKAENAKLRKEVEDNKN